MAHVVFAEKQFALPVEIRAELLEFVAQQVFLKQLLAQPQGDRHAERAEAARCVTEVGLEQTLELEKGLVVERDKVEFVEPNFSFFKAIADGFVRKRRVVLTTGEAFFL